MGVYNRYKKDDKNLVNIYDQISALSWLVEVNYALNSEIMFNNMKEVLMNIIKDENNIEILPNDFLNELKKNKLLENNE